MKLQCNSCPIWAILFLFSISTVSDAQTIWSEDFESYTDDSGYKGASTSGDYPSSVTKWSLEVINGSWADASWFMVNTVYSNNLFETVKPNSECVWTSETISISGYIDVVLQVSISEVGSLESSDYIKLYYILDGGAETLFAINGNVTNDFTSLTAIQAGLSGSTIQLIIKTKNNSLSEKIRFDDVSVKGVSGSSSLLFTEISDPSDEANARFVELKNTSSETIDFSVNTYFLSRQIDGSSWSEFQLTGSMCSGCIRTYAKSTSEFNSSYGYTPDYVNTIIDGDGDDAYFIYSGGDHSIGSVVDVYGVVDLDGTGENWEYTDKRSVRNSGLTSGVSSWDNSEWTLSSASTSSMTPGALEDEFRFFSSVWHPSATAPNTSSDSKGVVIQSGTATIAASFDCARLNVYAGSTLELNAGKGITVNGDLVNSGTLKLKSNATSNSSLITTGSSTGNIQYDLYVTGGVSSPWHLISAPVESQSINDFVTDVNNSIQTSASNNYGLAQYNPSTDAWNYFHNSSGVSPNIAASSAGNFIAAKGYSVLRSSTGEVSFTGSLNTASQTISLTADKWNLVGNPYSSFINVNSLADANDNIINISTSALNDSYEAIYLWNSTTTTYDIINHASTATYLSPGQGFYVFADSDGGDCSFTPAMQSHQIGDWFQRFASNAKSIKLYADFNLSSASTEIKYIENSTMGFDVGYDAGRFDGDESGYYIFSCLTEAFLDNTELGLQCIPISLLSEAVIIPIGVSISEDTPITFSLELLSLPEDLVVHIEDLLMSTFTRLDLQESVYSTTVDASESASGRFFVHAQASDLKTTEMNLTDFRVFVNNDSSTLNVIGNVPTASYLSLYDIMGRLIVTQELEGATQFEIPLPPLSTGVYVVQLSLNNKILMMKIII